MRNRILGLFLALSVTSIGALAATAKSKKKIKVDKRRKSNFSYSVGLEALETSYNLGMKSVGKKIDFTDYSSTLMGLKVSGSMELYLGNTLSTTTTASLFGSASIINQVDKFSESIDMEVGHYEKDNTFVGGEIGQTINMAFYNKTADIDIQPFVGMYIGKAIIDLDVDYKYDDLSTVKEYMRAEISDDINYSKLMAGVNFTNKKGIYSFIQASLINVLSGNRSTDKHEFLKQGETNPTIRDNGTSTDFETLYQLSIGVGYIF